jgi:hypothetical protein
MRRAVLVAVLVTCCGAGGCSASLAYNGETVGRSLARAIAVDSYYGCWEEDAWLVCEMRGRGLAEYVVHRLGMRCWRAELREVHGRAARPHTWPDRVNGCIRESDAASGAQRYD